MESPPESAPSTGCPVCSSSVVLWRVKRSAGVDYRIDACRSCGYAFVNPRPSLAFIMDFYSSFGHAHSDDHASPTLRSVLEDEQSHPNSTIDAKRIITMMKSLAPGGGGDFLDVGCGYGFFAKEAQDAGFRIMALELAANERGIATEMIGVAPTGCSFEEFSYPPGSLSAILMSQILEHALDVNAWIVKARDLLKNDGVLAIALPNYGSLFRMIMQANEPYICPPAHLNFFSKPSLVKLLARHGFRAEAAQWTSRISKRALLRRLPRISKPLIPVFAAVTTATMKLIDASRLGMMITVYARKLGDER